MAIVRRTSTPTFISPRRNGYVTASLILIVASAIMFSRFLAMSGLPAYLGNVLSEAQVGLTGLMIIYVLVILASGTALDSTSTVLITVPIFAPLFKMVGGDLVWVGIITMIAVEVGLITPPLGMSPFIVKASLRGDPLGDRIRERHHLGALPFARAALA